MDNAEDPGAESAVNSGVSDIENIGVDPVENDMINQVESPGLEGDSESTESDEKENVIVDEVNVESEKESGYNL